ncbi:MAG: MerR family transcriptional regulator [Firmicutes bacterium]|nr:MerR family transcriptional regulator [Bacillota bacterium]
MVDERVYSLREIADMLHVPESTLRTWRDQFAEFVPARGSGKTRKYGNLALEVFRRIATYREKGYQTQEIADALNNEFTMTVEIADNSERERERIANAASSMELVAKLTEAWGQVAVALENVADQSVRLAGLEQKVEQVVTETEASDQERRQEIQELRRAVERHDRELVRMARERMSLRKSWWSRVFGGNQHKIAY